MDHHLVPASETRLRIVRHLTAAADCFWIDADIAIADAASWRVGEKIEPSPRCHFPRKAYRAKSYDLTVLTTRDLDDFLS